MTANLSFIERLMKVIIPTRLQVMIVIFLSLATLTIIQSSAILHRLGLSDQALRSSTGAIKARFSVLSHSFLASNVTLVIFWSIIGLVAYLICWGIYNLIIEARNEVTLETQYENLGNTHGPLKTILIKFTAGIILIAVIASFRIALALAVAMASTAVSAPNVVTVIAGIMAVLILAFEIYLVFVSVELVLSSWYQPEAFTEE